MSEHHYVEVEHEPLSTEEQREYDREPREIREELDVDRMKIVGTSCPGTTRPGGGQCSTWKECRRCRDEGMSDDALDPRDEGEYERHGEHHTRIYGSWMVEEGACVMGLDRASEALQDMVRDELGSRPGVYQFDIDDIDEDGCTLALVEPEPEYVWILAYSDADGVSIQEVCRTLERAKYLGEVLVEEEYSRHPPQTEPPVIAWMGSEDSVDAMSPAFWPKVGRWMMHSSIDPRPGSWREVTIMRHRVTP